MIEERSAVEKGTGQSNETSFKPKCGAAQRLLLKAQASKIAVVVRDVMVDFPTFVWFVN